MADLESKLLYNDTTGYCSSSDEENAQLNEIGDSSQRCNDKITMAKQLAPRNQRNTGPKGVLEDYRICKRQLKEKEARRYKQIVEEAKRCTLSGPSDTDELEELRKKRLLEMKDCLYAIGKIDELTKKEEFLHYIESNQDQWILIHIYDNDNEGCITLNKIFNGLIVRYPVVKLAKVLSTVIGMSPQFSMKGLPTLQVYRNEILLGNFVRVTDQLGEEFTVDELVHFLKE
uniref:Phosducin thioredoxin-like domain-containing protein n=1 Tax=Setaria digitata TaxID=48799 RepID=A0A915Q6U9_9BILA